MKIILIYLIMILIVVFLYSIILEPELVTITHLEIRNSTVASALANKVIVQISDLHIRSIGKRELKVIEIIEQLQPDLIFLTGDYVYWNVSYQPALEFLGKLHAKVGIWGVLGDYDYNNTRQSCLFCHEPGSGSKSKQNNIHFLRNSFEKISVGNQIIRIGGIDDYQLEGSKESIFKGQLSSPIPTLLLCHNPLRFDELQPYQEIVMLSGDTHGGQIPLPSLLWHWLGYEKNAKYNYGLFSRGNNQLFVSRGVGYSHLPIRFCRKPEVVLIKFVSKQ